MTAVCLFFLAWKIPKSISIHNFQIRYSSDSFQKSDFDMEQGSGSIPGSSSSTLGDELSKRWEQLKPIILRLCLEEDMHPPSSTS
jgi:hypothetical protein